MNRAYRVGSLLIASLLAACGGRADSLFTDGKNDAGETVDSGRSDGGNGGDDAGTDVSIVPGDFVGSWDLTFTNVTPSSEGSPGPSSGSPSRDHNVRFDLRRTGTTLSGVVTPRWGEPAAVSVAQGGGALTLTGHASIYDTKVPNVSDTWSSIVLALGPDGLPAGTFTAQGDQRQSNGDEVFSAKLVGNGTAARDALAPELSGTQKSPYGPKDALLPWDPITVRAAEPLDATKLEAAFALGSGAVHLPLTWLPAATGDASWAGAVQVVAYRNAWDSTAGNDQLTGGGGVPDRVGHVSTALTQPVTFLDLSLKKQIVVSGDVTLDGAWGDVVPLGAKSGSDPLCESGGCFELGPFDASVCGAARIGIAGRLDLANVTTGVRVRYRVLSADAGNGTVSTPPYTSTAFVVDLAYPGAVPTQKGITIDTASYAALATPIGAMKWATAWTTTTLPTTPSVEVGVALRAGSSPNGPCGGFAPAPVSTIILVQSIDVQ